MTDEFNEWVFQKFTRLRLRIQDVGKRVEEKETRHFSHFEDLYDHGLAPECGQTLIPDRCQ